MPERLQPFFVLLILVIVGFLLTSGGCMAKYPNQNPTGKMFPTATGENLDKESVELPRKYLGKPALYMAGYSQNSQFDLDRWAIGLNRWSFRLRSSRFPPFRGSSRPCSRV